MSESNDQTLGALPAGLETNVLYHLVPVMPESNPEMLCAATSSTPIDNDNEIHLHGWETLDKNTFQAFVIAETDQGGELMYVLRNIFTNLPVSCEFESNIACAGGSDASTLASSFLLDSDGESVLIGAGSLYLTAPDNFAAGGQLTFSAAKENKTGQKWKFQKPTIGFVDTDGFKKL